jgi:5'-3' exonuclease
MPKLSTSDGVSTGAIFGFVRSLWSQVDKFKATHGFVMFDVVGSSSRRRDIDPGYKADRTKREFKNDFLSQWSTIHELVESAGFTIVEEPKWEADDIICSYAESISERSSVEKIRVYSTDHDLLQCLVNDRIEIIKPAFKGEEIWDRSRVVREYGMFPERLPELWTLCGDPGDCVPSIVGMMQARHILSQSSLDDYIKYCDTETRQRVEKNWQLVRRVLYPKLPELETPINWFGAIETFKQLEFKSFLKKLGAEVATTS